MIGTTISHYKIIEKLGEGGMGIVYKAHDTTLDRDVALKFLPRDVSLSEEERTRFIHEAKAASALDHPNICTIYEIDETPDGQMFIVMGYYEGRSISKMVEKGHLDVAEAVSVAIQIAEGLQAAHEKGIIHRDIKSSNIIVTDKGQVKILDFGLARKKGLSKLTKTGTTVGTASYMSPEQAKGEAVDHRTDLWSLGVVLYEMVTGHVPFRGEHEAAILYSVVNEEPQPIQTSVPDASPELVHIIRRALEKDPAERYRSAEDILIDLRRLKKDTSRTGFPPVSGTKKKAYTVRTRIFIAAAAIILIGAVGYLLSIKKGVEINTDYSLRWMNLPFNTIGNGPAVTADGKWIVFGAEDKNKRWDLWVAGVSGGEPRRVTQDSSDQAIFPDISPDGTSIVYNQILEKTYNIRIVSFNGGISKKIGVGNQPLWSPDGKRIGYVLDPTEIGPEPFQPSDRATSKSGNGEFWTMDPDGSGNSLEFADTLAVKSASEVYHAWSPDGRSVGWSHRLLRDGQEYIEIIIHDLRSHTERTLVSKGQSIDQLYWATNDHIIYSARVGAERNIWMIPAVGGSHVRITNGLANTGSPRLSADGRTLIFLLNKNVSHFWLAKADGSKERTEVKIGGEPYFWCPSISPDGKYITAVMMTQGGTYVNQVYIFNRDGTDMHQITTGEDYHWWPTWSPDGKMIFYYARGYYETYTSFRVHVVNVPRIDVPRFVSMGGWTTWADSVTLELMDMKTSQMWRVFLDGRPSQQFSADSIWAMTVGNGKYVIFQDRHQRALLAHEPARWCRAEDWDGQGPKTARALPRADGYYQHLGVLYREDGPDIYRVSIPDWKMIKLNFKRPDRQPVWGGEFWPTRKGAEMVYSSRESFKKIGVIENLFK